MFTGSPNQLSSLLGTRTQFCKLKAHPREEVPTPRKSESESSPFSEMTPHLKLPSVRARQDQEAGPRDRPSSAAIPSGAAASAPSAFRIPSTARRHINARREAIPASSGLLCHQNSRVFQQCLASSSSQSRCRRLPPGCRPRDHARLGETEVQLHYLSPRALPSQQPPLRVTTRGGLRPGAPAHAALAVSRAQTRPPLPPPLPPLPPPPPCLSAAAAVAAARAACWLTI